MIFLSDIPARKTFCLSGWNLTQYGILPFENACRHCPGFRKSSAAALTDVHESGTYQSRCPRASSADRKPH